MRLDHADESVVVVPSISLEHTTATTGTLVQAMEERALFLLLLLRQPRLRMVYVTSLAGAPRRSSSTTSACCRASSRATPAGPADAWSPSATPAAAPLSAKLLARPRVLREIRDADPQPGSQPPHPLQHDLARARRRAQPGHPDVRRRPAAGGPGQQDRLPTHVRAARGPVPGRGRGPAHAWTTSSPACRRCGGGGPTLAEAIVKLNEGVSGSGNALVDLRGPARTRAPTTSAEALRERVLGMALEDPQHRASRTTCGDFESERRHRRGADHRGRP